MPKFLKIAFTVVVILLIGYAFAYKSARVRNNFSNSAANTTTPPATTPTTPTPTAETVSNVRGSTQIGNVVNNYNADLSFSAQASGRTYVVNFPQKITDGQNGQYVLVLPYAQGGDNDKIVVMVTGASNSVVCTLTISSAGSGEAQVSASDSKTCSVSAAGDLVIANGGGDANSDSNNNNGSSNSDSNN